ncbi:MAG: toxin-antitoxin system protein [Lachnospiraceae bacterium]
MNMIYATYNIHHNNIDVYTYAGYFLRIDCNKAEESLKTTPCSKCALNALAIDEPLEYARLYLEGNIQMWVDVEDSFDL